MFKDRLTIFIIKRVAACFAVLAAISFFILEPRLYAISGLALGAFFGVFRLASSHNLLKQVLPEGIPSKAATKSIISLMSGILGIAVVLAASILVDIWMFAGVAIGVLLTVFVIMINIFTESTGLTHNNFE